MKYGKFYGNFIDRYICALYFTSVSNKTKIYIIHHKNNYYLFDMVTGLSFNQYTAQ